jgi:hypothetical protein
MFRCIYTGTVRRRGDPAASARPNLCTRPPGEWFRHGLPRAAGLRTVVRSTPLAPLMYHQDPVLPGQNQRSANRNDTTPPRLRHPRCSDQFDRLCSCRIILVHGGQRTIRQGFSAARHAFIGRPACTVRAARAACESFSSEQSCKEPNILPRHWNARPLFSLESSRSIVIPAPPFCPQYVNWLHERGARHGPLGKLSDFWSERESCGPCPARASRYFQDTRADRPRTPRTIRTAIGIPHSPCAVGKCCATGLPRTSPTSPSPPATCSRQ